MGLLVTQNVLRLVSTEAGGPPQTRSAEQKMLVDRGTQSCINGSNTRLCWMQIVFPSCKKVVDKQWKPGCRKMKDQYNILQVTRCLGLMTQRHTIQGKMSTKKLLLDAKPPSRTRRCLCVCWCVLSVMHVKLCIYVCSGLGSCIFTVYPQHALLKFEAPWSAEAETVSSVVCE